MAQLVIAAAGAAIGGMISPGVVAFGMTGASIGWMAGSMIGAGFGPTQKSEGPRLSDLSVSTSSYGTPIPYVAGSPRVAGQIVWASAKREIATTESAGKGGGGSEYTTFTYEVDLLILLTDNELDGVRRIWSNGEIIWSAVASAGTDSLIASATTTAWTRMTIYTGAAGQLPDPTYEAAVGTANAPAYRGRGAVFIEALQLGGGGQIPNLTFEVVQDGAVTTNNVGDGLLCHFDEMNGPKVASVLGPDLTATGALVSSPVKFGANAGGEGGFSCATATGVLDPAKHWRAEGWFYPSVWASTNADVMGLYNADPGVAVSVVSIYLTFQFGYLSYGYTYNNNVSSGSGLLASAANGQPVLNTWSHIALEYNANTGEVVIFQNGYRSAYLCDGNFNVGAVQQTFTNIIVGGARCTCDEFYYREITNDELYAVVADNTLAYAVPTNVFAANNVSTYAIEPNTTTVSSVVSRLADRTGLAAGEYSTTALSSITQPVRSMAISQVSSARTVLEMLAQTYHFDAVLSDKIYFKPRAAASVATLAYSELGVGVDPNADPLPLTTANELEIPAQMALTYNNVDGDYQTDTQYSDRLLTGQESTSAITVPLGFTSSEAKQIVDGVLLDKAVSSLTTKVQLGITRAALEPTDVVVITGDDASTYLMRVVKRTESAGVIDLECVLDDSTVFTQSGTTDGGTATQITVLATPTTTLALLDIPLLRDADNYPGFYVAVAGSASNWTSAAIYDSLDDLTYAQVNTMADQTAQGTCTSTLGNWTGGNVFDTTNTVTVSVGGGQTLSSVTYDDLLLSQATNAALIGSELVQYRTATLVSAGVYTLSNFLRGRRGTEWAQTGHVGGERFVVLGTSGLRYITLQTSDLGSARYYKAASAGQKLSAVSSQTITPAGISLECFSPVDARANRATTDTVLTWTRRTRLSTRLVGTLPISAPLGETTESYEVEVWDSGYTTLKRTLTSSTPTVTYTSAAQVTDFGSNQAVLYLKIYQLSAIVGRGYPLTVSV